jgi:[ribosomal protein S5]-alanine N-acetyltransferase
MASLIDPILTGNRVTLRRFVESDITPEYISWLNDPEVVRFSNQRFRRHDAATSLAYLRSFEGTDNLFLSARVKETDQAIGTLTAYVARQHGTADVGIMIGARELWGQGLGQDAWDTLGTWLLVQPGMRKWTAGALACNPGMLRLLERSGMHLEAQRREQEIVDGQAHDVLYYAKFRTT